MEEPVTKEFVRAEIAALRLDFEEKLNAGVRRTTATLMATMFAFNGALVGAMALLR